jgi:hypothetical protein
MLSTSVAEMPTPYGPMHQLGRNRAVDATTQPADQGSCFAYLVLDLGHRILDKPRGGPVSGKACNVKQKPLDQLPPAWRMRHLRMKLNAIQTSFGVRDCGKWGVVTAAKGDETGWHCGETITMAHPDVQRLTGLEAG